MSLPREMLAGERVDLDDPKFLLAAEVASIEVDLAGSIEGPRIAFDRAHVEALRVAGASRAEVRVYLESLFSPRLVVKLMDDLDSYGEWVDG